MAFRDGGIQKIPETKEKFTDEYSFIDFLLIKGEVKGSPFNHWESLDYICTGVFAGFYFGFLR